MENKDELIGNLYNLNGEKIEDMDILCEEFIQEKESGLIEENIDLNFKDIRCNDINYLKVYLDELYQFRVLTKEEEYDLFERYTKYNDQNAKDEIIKNNLRLVVSVAKRFYSRDIDFLDVLQEGNLGLMKAVDRFDYTKGYKFSTYATWWIRQAINKFYNEKSSAIRLPAHLNENINKYKNFVGKYESEFGRIPTKEEICSYFGYTMTKVEKIIYLANSLNLASLDVEIRDEDDSSKLVNFIESEDNIEEEVDKNLLKDDISTLLETLSPREKEVIKMRFGFYGGKIYSLEESGKKLGVTRERIRQIEAKALRKLKIASYRLEKKREREIQNKRVLSIFNNKAIYR